MLPNKTNIITDDKKFMKMHIIIPLFVVARRLSLARASHCSGLSLWSTDCKALTVRH